MCATGGITFIGRPAAQISGTHNVANLQKVTGAAARALRLVVLPEGPGAAEGRGVCSVWQPGMRGPVQHKSSSSGLTQLMSSKGEQHWRVLLQVNTRCLRARCVEVLLLCVPGALSSVSGARACQRSRKATAHELAWLGVGQRSLSNAGHDLLCCLQIMTKIGGTCLITIGVWCIIELAVQFGYYRHKCHMGSGECLAHMCPVCCK